MVTILQKWRAKMKETLDALEYTHTELVKKLNSGKVPTKQEIEFLQAYPDLLYTYRLVQGFLRQLPYKGLFKARTWNFYELIEKLNSMD